MSAIQKLQKAMQIYMFSGTGPEATSFGSNGEDLNSMSEGFCLVRIMGSGIAKTR